MPELRGQHPSLFHVCPCILGEEQGQPGFAKSGVCVCKGIGAAARTASTGEEAAEIPSPRESAAVVGSEDKKISFFPLRGDP